MNATNFGVIGITRAQTLQLHVAAFPPDPCIAQLGLQDVNGNPVGTTTTVSLQAGQSASLAINGNTLASSTGQRVRILPAVQPVIVISSTVIPTANQCVASAEVVDNVLGITSVLIPGSRGHSSVPAFGLLGVTELQTVRLNNSQA
jgi:hypothetical protein